MHKIKYTPTQAEIEAVKSKIGKARLNIEEYVTEVSNAYEKLHWWQLFNNKVVYELNYAKYIIGQYEDIELALNQPELYALDKEDIDFIDYWYTKNGEEIANI